MTFVLDISGKIGINIGLSSGGGRTMDSIENL